jgi:hypothetical protein
MTPPATAAATVEPVLQPFVFEFGAGAGPDGAGPGGAGSGARAARVIQKSSMVTQLGCVFMCHCETKGGGGGNSIQ